MTKLFSFLFILIFFKLNFAFSESLITSIEKYWNDINSMTGQFKQIDSDGNIQYGNFYLKKPHKSLFEYSNQEEKILTTKFFLHIINQKHFMIHTLLVLVLLNFYFLKILIFKNILMSYLMMLLIRLLSNYLKIVKLKIWRKLLFILIRRH